MGGGERGGKNFRNKNRKGNHTEGGLLKISNAQHVKITFPPRDFYNFRGFFTGICAEQRKKGLL